MKNYFILLLVVCCLINGESSTQAQIIVTVAGNGVWGHTGDGGPAIHAEIGGGGGLAFDHNSNLYFGDADTNDVRYIRKIDSYGIISTIAGGGTSIADGIAATLAQLDIPFDVAVDNIGNIYFAEGDSKIRKIDTSGIISTIAGTGTDGYNGDSIPATSAQIFQARYIALDRYRNLYISDYMNSRVRKIDTMGFISTIAGTGRPGWSGDGRPATLAQINYPLGIAVDSSENIYIADGNDVIRKINDSGIITTFAGNLTLGFRGDGGPAPEAEFNFAIDVAADDSGNVYIDDGSTNERIRKVNRAGIISTIAGNGITGFSGDGGPATNAELNSNMGITTDKNGNVFFSDLKNYRLRAIVGPLSVEASKLNSIDMSVYPNPNSGSFAYNISTNVVTIANVVITNVMGEIVYKNQVQTNRPLNLTLSVPSGVYSIQAVASEGILQKTIIVNR